MEVLFRGICTHIQTKTFRTLPHVVVLPAANYYTVHPSKNTSINIPNHTAVLAVKRSDVVDPDEVATFGGDGLLALDAGDDVYAWSLDSVRISFKGLSGGPLSKTDLCVPRLSAPGRKLRVNLEKPMPDSLAAMVEVSQGESLKAAFDADVTGPVEQSAVHTVLTAPVEGDSWQISVRSKYDPPPGRNLTLKAGAQVTIQNEPIDPAVACNTDDYLLHYRITTAAWVPLEEFRIPDGCQPEKRSLKVFPRFTHEDTETLSSCSNSQWP